MARATKKKLLKAMEGKHHDRKKPYSRKGRGKKVFT